MHSKKTYWISAALVVIVVFLIGFAAGKARAAPAATAARAVGGFARGAAAGAGGGFTTGQIVKIESGDLVVSTQGGGSKVVLVSTSTPVMKTVSGSISDLAVGQNVMVSGATNSDGSVSATSIRAN